MTAINNGIFARKYDFSLVVTVAVGSKPSVVLTHTSHGVICKV